MCIKPTDGKKYKDDLRNSTKTSTALLWFPVKIQSSIVRGCTSRTQKPLFKRAQDFLLSMLWYWRSYFKRMKILSIYNTESTLSKLHKLLVLFCSLPTPKGIASCSAMTGIKIVRNYFFFQNQNQSAPIRSSDDWQPLRQAGYLQNHLDETGLFYTWSHTCAKPIKHQKQTVKYQSAHPGQRIMVIMWPEHIWCLFSGSGENIWDMLKVVVINYK